MNDELTEHSFLLKKKGCYLSYRVIKQYLPSKLNFGGTLGQNQRKPRHHMAPRTDHSPVYKW